jgi:hypothetical protein
MTAPAAVTTAPTTTAAGADGTAGQRERQG